MFIAKFVQTTNSEIFKEDSKENLPFIGDLIAGTATGTIYNGTMFLRNEFKPGVAYLCNNFVTKEYPKNVQTLIIAEIPMMDLIPMMAQCGPIHLARKAKTSETPE